MNIARLQQAIDRIVPIRARTLGLEFQAAPCAGRYYMVGDEPHRRLKLYRPCAPTQEAVTDTAIEMLSRIHERFGPGRVWTVGNNGASKRIGIHGEDGTAAMLDGKIMLRIYFVHEHDTGPANESDPESKWPWSEPSARVPSDDGYEAPWRTEAKQVRVNPTCPLCGEPCDRVEVGGVKINGCPCVGSKDRAIAVLNDDLKAGRVKILAPPVWNHEYLGEWFPPSPEPPLGNVVKYKGKSPNYAPIAIDKATLEAMKQAPAFYDTLRREADKAIAEHQALLYRKLEAKYGSIPTGTVKIEGSADGDRWFSLEGQPTLSARLGHLKHGPSGSGLAGPCDPDCAKCRVEQAYKKNTTPAGRMEAVLVLAQEGRITAEQARKLLEAPEFEPRAPDPLDVKHGGVTLRDLLKIDEERRRESHPNYRTAWSRLSDAQRAAVSAHWSAQLHARVTDAKERERQRVVVDQEVD